MTVLIVRSGHRLGRSRFAALGQSRPTHTRAHHDTSFASSNASSSDALLVCDALASIGLAEPSRADELLTQTLIQDVACAHRCARARSPRGGRDWRSLVCRKRACLTG